MISFFSISSGRTLHFPNDIVLCVRVIFKHCWMLEWEMLANGLDWARARHSGRPNPIQASYIKGCILIYKTNASPQREQGTWRVRERFFLVINLSRRDRRSSSETSPEIGSETSGSTSTHTRYAGNSHFYVEAC